MHKLEVLSVVENLYYLVFWFVTVKDPNARWWFPSYRYGGTCDSWF